MNWGDFLDPNTSFWWAQTNGYQNVWKTDGQLQLWFIASVKALPVNRIDGSKGNYLLRLCQENVIYP